MTDQPTSPAVPESGGPSLASPDVQNLLRSFGQALNGALLYGFSHKVPQQALADSHACVLHLLEMRETLTFSVTEAGLLVEGEAIDSRNSLGLAFARRIQALDMQSFDLLRGITLAELTHLMQMLILLPERLRAEGTLVEVLARRGVTHIRANSASFQKISESDLVMKKDNLLEGLAGMAATMTGEKPKSVEQIVAFLKGDAGSGDTFAAASGDGDGKAKGGASPETDAANLADMILKVADVRQQAAETAGGESLVDLVVGSLRRHTGELMKSPESRTKQGRKNIAKTLLLLEKKVLDRLREMAGGGEAGLEPVHEVMEELQSDLAVEDIAADYMKKRAAMGKAESRLKRYLKRTAAQDPEAVAALQEKLQEEGMTPDGWRQLQVGTKEKAAVPVRLATTSEEGFGSGGGGDGASGGMGDGMKTLAVLLTQLDSMFGAPGEREELGERRRKFKEIAGKISDEVERTAVVAEAKIEGLSETVVQLAAAAETAEQKQQHDMSRRRLLEVLAEIIQELFQPLSVVNGTLELLLSNRMGDMPEEQESLLRLSAKSSQRLTLLSEKLRSICGNPGTLIPDAEILRMLYPPPPA